MADDEKACRRCGGSGIDPASTIEALPCYDCDATGDAEVAVQLDWERNRGC